MPLARRPKAWRPRFPGRCAKARAGRGRWSPDSPTGGTLFEELGFSYIGPVDGHDMGDLLAVLRTAKVRASGPVLIHAITKKGKGYGPAETAADKYHGVAKFDVISGEQKATKSNAPGYTKVFGQALGAGSAA